MSDKERSLNALDGLLQSSKIRTLEDLESLLTKDKIGAVDAGTMMAQGATLRWADEIWAGIQAPFSEKDYGTLVKEKRENIERIEKKDPWKALMFEGVGGMIPSAFTSGAGNLNWIDRLRRASKIGAGGGAVYGAGRGEGFGDKVGTAVTDAAMGAAINPAFDALLSGAKKVVTPLIDSSGRTVTKDTGKAVEDEILRIINNAGISIDEAVERISKGEIIGDMNADTINALGSLASESQSSKQMIKEALERRSSELRNKTMIEMQDDLITGTSVSADGGDVENVTLAVNNNMEALLKKEDSAYEAIWSMDKYKVSSNTITSQVAEILERVPSLRAEIVKDLQAAGLDPIFKVTTKGKNKGKIEMLRGIELETAEAIRGSLNDLIFSSPSKRKKILKPLEVSLRNQIDEFAPELAQARLNWSNIKKAQEAFEAGKKVFTSGAGGAEQIDIDFKKLTAKGNPELIAAYRAGFAVLLKNKLGSAQGANLVNVLDNLDRNERKVLEIIYPNDDLANGLSKLQNISEKINLASKARLAETKAGPLTNSQSVRLLKGSQNIGAVNAGTSALQAIAGDMSGVARLASGMVRNQLKGKGMSEDQLNRVAQLLISEDPEVVKKALSDKRLMAQIRRRIDAFANKVVGGASGGGTVGALSSAEDLSSGGSNTLQEGFGGVLDFILGKAGRSN